MIMGNVPDIKEIQRIIERDKERISALPYDVLVEYTCNLYEFVWNQYYLLETEKLKNTIQKGGRNKILDEIQITHLRHDRENGMSFRQLAKKYKVVPSTVSNYLK